MLIRAQEMIRRKDAGKDEDGETQWEVHEGFWEGMRSRNAMERM